MTRNTKTPKCSRTDKDPIRQQIETVPNEPVPLREMLLTEFHRRDAKVSYEDVHRDVLESKIQRHQVFVVMSIQYNSDRPLLNNRPLTDSTDIPWSGFLDTMNRKDCK